jgi:proteasome alpha subunit
MSMPFYASAEQIMRDRSEYARKGIARGRSVVVLTYADGVLFVAENASSALHKVSEIYDRIGFAAVGKYNEFENLRVAGIRLADLRGYSYDRQDVTARALANAYAQTLGNIFTEQQKPYEVELCVAEVGTEPNEDQMYRLSYDGTIVDEPQFLVMGGQADALTSSLRQMFTAGLPLRDALQVAVGALGAVGGDGSARDLPAAQLEVAVLDRTRANRKFRRYVGAALTALLPAATAEQAAAPVPADTPPHDVTLDQTADRTAEGASD